MLPASIEPTSFFRCPLEQAGGEWGGGRGKGNRRRARRSGHVNNNSVLAGPFQAVTVNLFDLSLCKSLQRLKASLLDCGGRGEAAGFLCAFLTMMIIKFVSGHPAVKL